MSKNFSAEDLALKAFWYTMLALVLYVGAVFLFVL
jgi:hypothetical protein